MVAKGRVVVGVGVVGERVAAAGGIVVARAVVKERKGTAGGIVFACGVSTEGFVAKAGIIFTRGVVVERTGAPRCVQVVVAGRRVRGTRTSQPAREYKL